MPRSIFFVLTIALFLLGAPAGRGEDLDVPLEKAGVQEPSRMMRRYLLRQVEQACRQWEREFEGLKTPSPADTNAEMDQPRWDPEHGKLKIPENVTAYQERLRNKILQALGGLPERTPLEPQVVGTVSRPAYRVEKVIFQSQPKHFVTALLYLPDAPQFKPPYPGVLIACGHSLEGKGSGAHQMMGALLALNGMAALVFDPIEQGERQQYQYPGHLGGRDFTTTRHTMIGMGSLLLGTNAARFEIWDGMRAIDYLQSRPEVDPQRIGCAGNSGGGTQTGYLMALDDRIRCAAPSCWITTMSRLLDNPGAQDSEQNIFGQLQFGVDCAHWILMRAPSPVLVCAAAKDDYFDIRGTWETFRYAKRLYSDLGLPERIDLVESSSPHGYHRTHREATARWMSRWLLNRDQVITEPKITYLSEEEYRCVPTGNVMSLPGARSVYDLNEDYENKLAGQRASSWASGNRAALLAEVRRLAGIRKLTELPAPRVERLGALERDAYRIEKMAIVPEEGIALSALLFLPKQPQPGPVVLYLHDQGKAADARPGGPIEQRVLSGRTVLAVDLRGTGQTRASENDAYYSHSWQDAYTAYLMGRSYVGMRAEDILVCARYAAEGLGSHPGGLSLVAVGNVGVPALHAAALEPDLFDQVAISRTLISWSNVIHSRLNQGLMASMVHGVLTHYDLPNLAAVVGDKLTISQPTDAMGKILEGPKRK